VRVVAAEKRCNVLVQCKSSQKVPHLALLPAGRVPGSLRPETAPSAGP
jgi:hypothetical protein